ncbi:NAD-dependent epimerase/dehydratase [Hyphomicrobium denitrificans ATCC 51888]|uniref:NAD-dependent epimerase/dehydratase n=1 Tax=Hyphomicrobium denitrificans (strain ATCC 51888 / DSM 1869 / NCIMB 11706 / TK 0415) TaxID=582899 RepID=D8JSV4_HYPDA|nr:SDR family oxidoreductase [Hyphomicrobium denitrificans]ADJ22439.1 NAD-dependent epimerase/dehydratase [Hyphomicrobium denitrificans ATCC 51888]
MALILVIGASRGIGLETVKAALAAGHKVRAFARSAPSIDISDPNLTKITGDARVRGEVAAAVQGVDAVIYAVGATSLSDLLLGTTLFSDSTRALVEAMQGAGVRRLMMVTGAGAGNSRGRINFLYDNLIFPLVLQRAYNDKDIAEDIVEKSGLDWTIARPGGLTNRSATGRYKILNEPKDWRGGFISRADVANFLVKHLDDATLFGKTPLLVD